MSPAQYVTNVTVGGIRRTVRLADPDSQSALSALVAELAADGERANY
jgi:hypothetical protein